MRARQPRSIPSLWLMTDERIGDALFDAIERLPRFSGIVFRHYSLPPADRRALFARIQRIAARHGHVLLRAGADRLAIDEAGVHGQARGAGHRFATRSAHSPIELIAAIRAGVDAAFVSPVYTTRSHPGGRPLGRVRLGLMIRGVSIPIIALGGMTPDRGRALAAMRIGRWAAIDAWTAPSRDR